MWGDKGGGENMIDERQRGWEGKKIVGKIEEGRQTEGGEGVGGGREGGGKGIDISL